MLEGFDQDWISDKPEITIGREPDMILHNLEGKGFILIKPKKQKEPKKILPKYVIEMVEQLLRKEGLNSEVKAYLQGIIIGVNLANNK